MLRNVNQPGQDGTRAHLKHPSHRADAQPFGQGAHGPHQHVERDTLAMQRRAVGFLEIATTAGAMQLAPGATVGVTIGTDIAEPDPAPIVAGGMGAEVPRRVHLARAAARGHDTGWRAPGRLGSVLVGLLTGGTGGRGGEAREWLRVAGALARRRQRLGWPLLSSGTLIWPGIMQHDAEPEESQEHQLVEKEVGYHGKAPSHRW